MCGFTFLFNVDASDHERDLAFQQIASRGPEVFSLQSTDFSEHKEYLAFHRLCINSLNDAANQPLYINNSFHNDAFLLCNGEIYNYKSIFNKFVFYKVHNDVSPQQVQMASEVYQESRSEHTTIMNPEVKLVSSMSDCEVILHLYFHFYKLTHDPHMAAVATAKQLDGEFAFVIYDIIHSFVHIVRDPLGVRPLYWSISKESFGVCSELKGLHTLLHNVEQFPPGQVTSVNVYNLNQLLHLQHLRATIEPELIESTKYFVLPAYHQGLYKDAEEELSEQILQQVRFSFMDAVTKRLMSERPVCALLSGGLDSSLVAAIVADAMAPAKLDTFSIGIEGSTDLKYAQMVADHIDSRHHVIQLTETDFLNSIEETIRIIESYDVTSVRASVGNLLVAKYIREHTTNKVVFNGDYSDELAGGYLYFKNAPTDRDFHEECIRLLSNIHYFDSLRSDRTISSQGLEARVPFADSQFVYMYLQQNIKFRSSHDKMEKWLLRKAFDSTQLLPKEVLWRRKEAFSDGVSSKERSWYQVIQEYIDTKVTDEEYVSKRHQYTVNPPLTKEAYYYRKIFDSFYPNCEDVLPYFWLPRWSGNVIDPSARVLEVYKQTE